MALTDTDRKRLERARDTTTPVPLSKIERGRFRAIRTALHGEDAALVDTVLSAPGGTR